MSQLRDGTRNNDPPAVCVVDGCGGKHLAKGYCTKHYTQISRGQKIDAYEKHRKPGLTGDELADWFVNKLVPVRCKVKGLGPCLIWNKKGRYGMVYVDGELRKAHHYAFFLEHDRWPAPGKYICHHCDTPLCCNSLHIYEGDAQQNVDDKVRRGRQARGETLSTLTTNKVQEIRRLYSTGGYTQHQLADKFGVGRPAIQGIVNGRTWKHV